METILQVLDPILFSIQDTDQEQRELRIDEQKEDQLLRSGEAVMLMNEMDKQRIKVDAQFRPYIRKMPTMSESEFTATDTEAVLQVLERTRQAETLPSASLEGKFQCCHIETMKMGTGARRKATKVRCQNMAALNELRCPIHAGLEVLHQKDIQHLLVSDAERGSQRTYFLMKDVYVIISTPIESSKLRHPMSMASPDIPQFKDYQTTRLLLSKLQETHGKLMKHKHCPVAMKFPESEYRLEFGAPGAHPDWEGLYEWVKFSIEEIAPDQMLPSDWNRWSEFWYKFSKQYGWFQYPEGADEFLPDSKFKYLF